MNTSDLILVLKDCDEGGVKFNKRKNLRSFLYGNKWYPLRACVNEALKRSKEKGKTTDAALVEVLVDIGLWTRIKLIANQTTGPIKLTREEKNEEVRVLSEALYNLTR
ncbi:MAG: hypothetical protein K1X81_02780 [Bacteroidia bacterium]|nr:hypothetical protein [Bacteroidia bacterium]